MRETNGRECLKNTIQPIVVALMNVVDAYVAMQNKKEDSPFDYKKDLKSPKKIAEIRKSVIPSYQMAVDSKFTKPFSVLWEESKP